MYRVEATVKDGICSRKLPIFFLDEEEMGLDDIAHAKIVARSIIDPLLWDIHVTTKVTKLKGNS